MTSRVAEHTGQAGVVKRPSQGQSGAETRAESNARNEQRAGVCITRAGRSREQESQRAEATARSHPWAERGRFMGRASR